MPDYENYLNGLQAYPEKEPNKVSSSGLLMVVAGLLLSFATFFANKWVSQTDVSIEAIKDMVSKNAMRVAANDAAQAYLITSLSRLDARLDRIDSKMEKIVERNGH